MQTSSQDHRVNSIETNWVIKFHHPLPTSSRTRTRLWLFSTCAMKAFWDMIWVTLVPGWSIQQRYIWISWTHVKYWWHHLMFFQKCTSTSTETWTPMLLVFFNSGGTKLRVFWPGSHHSILAAHTWICFQTIYSFQLDLLFLFGYCSKMHPISNGHLRI